MKTKATNRVGAADRMKEVGKHQMLKESSSTNGSTTVKAMMKGMVEKVDPVVRGELSKILEEYCDIFPETLPYGPPLKRIIDHEIEVARCHCTEVKTTA